MIAPVPFPPVELMQRVGRIEDGDYGCDIDEPSIAWAEGHLSPPVCLPKRTTRWSSSPRATVGVSRHRSAQDVPF
jgi:hypothetical protein